MENNQIQTTDTIFHIAQVIIDIRNKKKDNIDNIARGLEKTIIANPFAIFKVSDECNYFTQIAVEEDPAWMHAEISNVHEDKFKLPYHKHMEIQRMGWNAPTTINYPNYWRKFEVYDDNASYVAAAEIVLAMIKFFDYRPFMPLNVEVDYNELEYEKIFIPSKFDPIRRVARNTLLFLASLLEKKG